MSNLSKLITATLEQIQLREDVIQTVISQRHVNNALGFQLDLLGKITGQPRGGIADDDIYRRYVRSRVITTRSGGQPETIYRVARSILGATDHTLEIDNTGAASYVLRVLGDDLDDVLAALLIKFIRVATSNGVRAILEYSTALDDVLIWGEGNWAEKNWGSGTDGSF